MGIYIIWVYNLVFNFWKYDFYGDFIWQWVLELARLFDDYIYVLWEIFLFELQFIGFELGKDYFNLIVDLKKVMCYVSDQFWGFKDS